MLKHDMFAHLADSLSDVRNHAVMNAAIVLAAFLTWASEAMWPDVLASLGILCVNAGAVEDIWLAARQPSSPLDP
jgi:Co/Zn/Cd efflux system component